MIKKDLIDSLEKDANKIILTGFEYIYQLKFRNENAKTMYKSSDNCNVGTCHYT